MPRQALLVTPTTVEIHDDDDPALEPGQVRIRSEFGAAKHGTEIAMGIGGSASKRGGWDPALQVWRPERPPIMGALPSPIGNQIIGTIVETSSELPVGARVATHSGFRETVVATAARCWLLPEDMAWQNAVCEDPAEFALAAVRDAQVRVGDAVAIFGLGAIGLMGVQLARIAGAGLVIAVDPMPNRREIALATGADLALDPAVVDAGLEIKTATNNRGADVVIEYSGNMRALQAALRGVAFGGTVACGAFPPPYPEGLDLGAEAHMNRPNIVFTRACSDPNRDHPRWNEARIVDHCRQLLAAGRLDGTRIVDPIVPFDELPAAYLKIASDPASNIKLGVSFG